MSFDKEAGLMWGRIVLGGLALLAGAVLLGAASEKKTRDRNRRRLRNRLEAQLRRAAELLEVQVDPQLVERSEGNAAADTERIYFNPAWFEAQLRDVCGGDVACEDGLMLGVMAHELAHVAEKHACTIGDLAHDRGEEHVADEWAAKALARARVPVEFVEPLWEKFCEVCPASTHPPRSERIAHLRQEYEAERSAMEASRSK